VLAKVLAALLGIAGGMSAFASLCRLSMQILGLGKYGLLLTALLFVFPFAALIVCAVASPKSLLPCAIALVSTLLLSSVLLYIRTRKKT